MLLDASLDTSFWTCASQIGVAPYLFSFFRIHYSQAIEREIVTTNPSETTLIYPQAMLFTIFQEDGRLHRREPTKPLALFGTGEAHAIALAKENNWLLLINDRRPLAFARSLGISTVSIPSFCVLLYSQGKITLAAVNGYLNRLASTTSPVLIAEAEQSLMQIVNLRESNHE